MRKQYRDNRGFSLIEMSLVLLILGILIGTTLKPLGAQFELLKVRRTEVQLKEVRDALLGFAVVNGRLPCPASSVSHGHEIVPCSIAHGFVPAAELGVSGSINKNGLLLDAWNRPLRYSVSMSDSSAHGQPGVPDFVSDGEMRAVGMQHLKADLVICAKASNASCSHADTRASGVPAVLYSLGKTADANGEQKENLDDDTVFVTRPYSDNTADTFDDIVLWLSDNILYTRLIEVGIFP